VIRVSVPFRLMQLVSGNIAFKKRLRPKVVVAPNADPWLLADEALDLLDDLRRRLGGRGAADVVLGT
jgi:hypothetical protein